MKIRPAKSSDYNDLMKLYNLFVESDRYSKHNNDSFEKVLSNPRNFIYVAEEDNHLVDFATCSIRDVVRYPKPIAELDELMVHPDFRKHGLGKKFMDVIEKKAKEYNCYRIFIESHYDHKGAHKFYEALGYTNYGYHFIKNL